MDMQQSNIKTPIKATLPKFIVSKDNLNVKFLLKKEVQTLPAVVIEYVMFTDRFGQSSRSEAFYVPLSGATKPINCNIPVPKEPFLAKSHTEISILSSSGIKHVVTFGCDTHINPVSKFVASETRNMTPKEIALCAQVTKEYLNAAGNHPPQPPGHHPCEDLLQHHRNAVYTEMFFLKNSGGRKYKITSGKFIDNLHGFYAYQFELESEVFLADDSPVTVSSAAGVAEGIVMLCDGFEIVLLLNKDLGKTLGSAVLSVEPWKLLEALNKRLENFTHLSPIAQKLLYTGPSLATKQPAAEILKGQAIARDKALSSDITVIWGPPGTGKTHTMSEIAISLLEQGKSVLLVSHSNVSVDGLAAKIAALLRDADKEHLLKDGKVLRYGYVRDEQLSKDPYTSAYNYTLEKSEDLREQLNQLNKEKETAKSVYGQHSKEVLELEEKTKFIRKQVRLRERKYVEKAQIVATTVSKIYADSLFENHTYDAVMFDEASMAYIAQIICAATFAKERFICVGDFRQLSPIAQSKAKDVLSKDIFSFLGISDGFGQIYNHPWLVMLDEQRRMHPRISYFANNTVYAKLLKNHSSVEAMREHIVNREPFAGHSMNMIDLTGTYCATGKNSDNSRFNIMSAVLAFGSAIAAEAHGEDSVGIITPYAAQTRLIRAMIQDYRKTAKTNTTCATVHQFQGSERNVVIFDAVESYPSTKTGWLMSKNDNGSVTRLINVAVTRAKGKLITIANRGYWTKKFKSSDHTFYKLVNHSLQNENVIGVKEKKLQEYLAGLNLGKDIKIFTERTKAYAHFSNDVERAKKSLLVSIPGTSKFELDESAILSLFKTANSNGIKLMIKAKNFEILPDEWKEYSWDCDNAVFPIVLVDDKVLWFGFPKATGTFKDGKEDGFTTVFPVWIRFSGEHTVELIKSLASLDMRFINNMSIPMSEKKSSKKCGIGSYISKHEKCSKCGNPMMLSKTKTGKVNLICPNCNNTEWLKPDTVNHYIKMNGVVCPICSKKIFCGLSYNGLYIKCPGSHWPKVEEL